MAVSDFSRYRHDAVGAVVISRCGRALGQISHLRSHLMLRSIVGGFLLSMVIGMMRCQERIKNCKTHIEFIQRNHGPRGF